MKLVLIDSSNINKKNISLLYEFERNIYNKSFPDEEREYITDIIKRIESPEKWEPSTLIVLKLNDNKVIGGVIADYYSNSNCLEIIYIALDPLCRGKGEGYKLLWDSIKIIKQHTNQINNIFIEVEKIHNRPLMECEMDPSERIHFWNKCGAKQILINYVQPPLSNDKEAIYNLMLMALPLDDGMEINLSKDILKDFLKDFYRGLKADKSEHLYNMFNEIDNNEIQTLI